MKKVLMIALLIFFVTHASAGYNTSYLPVIELKTWNHAIDVYINHENQCKNPIDKKRYLLAPSKKNDFAALMMAMATKQKVSLRYECNQQGYPSIIGVRVRAN